MTCMKSVSSLPEVTSKISLQGIVKPPTHYFHFTITCYVWQCWTKGRAKAEVLWFLDLRPKATAIVAKVWGYSYSRRSTPVAEELRTTATVAKVWGYSYSRSLGLIYSFLRFFQKGWWNASFLVFFITLITPVLKINQIRSMWIMIV